ncbi:MAG: exodeoxyribonuclease III [Castellaniella sp.]
MLSIITANLNGIRSAVNKGFLDWLAHQDADFVCLQELKAQEANLSPEMRRPHDLQGYFHYAERKGYSGVGIYTRHEPDDVIVGVGVPEIDAEGRYLELCYPGFSVISVYLPSGSSGDHRQAVKFEFMDYFQGHLQALADSGRQIVLCGDWNIAHKEIDLKNWRSNRKNSGFLPEEREWLGQLFDVQGWVDVYRHLHPDLEGESYTWWSNRGQAWANNVGWRLDYHIATADLARTARSAHIYKEERFSDHAPLTIHYDWSMPAAG